jgi:hypothetical protein
MTLMKGSRLRRSDHFRKFCGNLFQCEISSTILAGCFTANHVCLNTVFLVAIWTFSFHFLFSGAKSIAGKNYKRVTAALSSEPDQVGILRKDGDLFSSVTLDQWTFNRDPSLKAFHVATNKESSIGVIFGDSSFPISQIFLSSADKIFEGMIRDNPSIVDVPRDELEKADVPQHPERRKIEGSPALLNEENKTPGSVEEDRDFPTRPAKSSGGTIDYLFAAVLAIIIVGSAFYVSWKSKRS